MQPAFPDSPEWCLIARHFWRYTVEAIKFAWNELEAAFKIRYGPTYSTAPGWTKWSRLVKLDDNDRLLTSSSLTPKGLNCRMRVYVDLREEAEAIRREAVRDRRRRAGVAKHLGRLRSSADPASHESPDNRTSPAGVRRF